MVNPSIQHLPLSRQSIFDLDQYDELIESLAKARALLCIGRQHQWDQPDPSLIQDYFSAIDDCVASANQHCQHLWKTRSDPV